MVVVADGLELPGNLGTDVRCADGAGATGVLLTGGHVRPTHPLVVKASTEAVFALPVVDIGRDGLSSFWRNSADVLVSIPMLGVADSLNVGHAAALLLYEAVGQQDPASPRDLSSVR